MSLPILGIVLLHLLLIVYAYIFTDKSVKLLYLSGDIFLLCVMTGTAIFFLNKIRIKIDKKILDGGLSDALDGMNKKEDK